MDLGKSERVYSPREDSFLLQRVVGNYCLSKKPKRVLDIGTGSGIQAITARVSGAEQVTAVDINPEAVRLAKKNAKMNKAEIEVLQSDMFSRVHGKYNLIMFNPPYLPVEPPIDVQWSGGKEFIEDFLRKAHPYLEEGGKIIFVYSSVDKVRTPHKVLAQETMPDGEILYVAQV